MNPHAKSRPILWADKIFKTEMIISLVKFIDLSRLAIKVKGFSITAYRREHFLIRNLQGELFHQIKSGALP